MNSLASSLGNMHRSWHVIWIVLASVLVAISASTTAAIGQDSARTITVRVDPRVELLSIIFRLAGNPEYNQARLEGYAKQVDQHFGPHRDHPVVRLAQQVRATRGVSYDAVMSLAIHLTDTVELGEVISFDEPTSNLEPRWSKSRAREFISLAREFAKTTRFAEFVERQRGLYTVAENRMAALVSEHADLDWFDSFFGSGPNAEFKLVIGMLNGPANYGTKVVHPDGRETLYAIIGTWLVDEVGEPRFDTSVLPTVVHEFCHSYANPLIEANLDGLRSSGQQMYPCVEAAMKRQAYGNWETMLKESLVRACVVRYILDHRGEESAAKAIAHEENEQHFLWTGQLVHRLDEFVANRDRFPRLGDFMPHVVDLFNEVAPAIAADKSRRATEHQGQSPQVVSIDPPDGATDVDPATQEIVIEFDRPMRKDIVAVMLGPGGQGEFPEVKSFSFDESGRLFTLNVRLQPNKRYRFSLGAVGGNKFMSAQGEALAPIMIVFHTAR